MGAGAGAGAPRSCRSALAALSLAGGLLAVPSGVPAQQRPYRVLFIGNSLTYQHAMPQMFAGLARAGGRAVEIQQHAPGGAKLSDHARNPAVRALLARGGWDAVVLQEQSQLPAFADDQVRREVDPFATQLAQLTRASNPRARIVLYQTPARRNGDRGNAQNVPELSSYDGMQRRLNATYRRLASQVGGTLVPAGAAWQMARRERADINLYGDDVHPNREGAYLIACTFYAKLLGRNPVGLSFTADINPQVAAALQQFAQRAAQTEY